MKKANNAKNNAAKQVTNNANAQAKTPSVYVGMYAQIKQAANTPSAVVKSFYNAAMSIEGGAYAEYYKQIFGNTKNDFCQTYTPVVIEAFKKQTRCKNVSLFFVWRVVYKNGLCEYIKTAKTIAAHTGGAEKTQKALKALESLGEAAKAASK